MPQDIKITEQQIALAESVLLPQGKVFDEQRRTFICDLTTHDLHAVPGSGKTTALLAKLIALEQHLPFLDRSGILVISHTNAAVDEIKHKIGHICPHLFSSPNFVGTVQAFVNTFFAIPYYKTVYKRRPVRIDDEIYIENHHPDFNLKSWLDRRADGEKILYDYRLREGDNLTLKLEAQDFPFKNSTGTYQKILAIKKEIREKGFMCFDDAYILAEEYIKKFPGVINIIRQRFKYVFVDEMQDIDKHQYDLLEALFGTTSEVVYQRIGDKNQAIYNAESKILDIWQERNVKEINGSHRLHSNNAAIVESVALSPISVVGNRKNSSGSDIDIKPVMIVYTDETVSDVIPKFIDLIQGHIDSGKIQHSTENIYKAIAWTTSKPGDKADAIKLNSYYKGFSKEHSKLRISYPSLESYLVYYDEGSRSLASIRKSILNGVLRVIRIEGVVNPINGRAFTKRSLVEYIKEQHHTYYNDFKLQVYKVAALVKKKDRPAALAELILLSTNVLNAAGKSIKGPTKFMTTPHVEVPTVLTSTASTEITNRFSKNGIDVDITTVHAVKGQTHTCTLYMESFYQTNVGKKGQYESSRIVDQLQGKPLPDGSHEYIKQSLKMAYVGFSRPTHLLGFAIHKSRYDALYKGQTNIDRWAVFELSSPASDMKHGTN